MDTSRDILIFCGQSNMQGYTESCPVENAVIGGHEYRYLTNTIVPLSHPVGEDIGESKLLMASHEGKGSLIPDFCRAYIEKTHREVLAVHAACAGTHIAEWLPPAERYDALIRKAQGALSKLAERSGRVYFIWLQGESDAIRGVSEDEYIHALEELRGHLYRDLPLDGFGIIRVGKFVEDERDLAILRAQETACRNGDFLMLTRVTAVCTQAPSLINPYAPGHYSNAGMTLIGQFAGANLGRHAIGEPLVTDPEAYTELM